jgi:hypothetical protein
MAFYKTTIKWWHEHSQTTKFVEFAEDRYDLEIALASAIATFKQDYPPQSLISVKCEPIS